METDSRFGLSCGCVPEKDEDEGEDDNDNKASEPEPVSLHKNAIENECDRFRDGTADCD